MSDIDFGKLVQCAAREAALRRNVYPKFVANGRMTQEAAAKELALMEQITKVLVIVRDSPVKGIIEHFVEHQPAPAE